MTAGGKQTAAERRARAAQARRAQLAAERRRRLLVVGGGSVVAVIAVVAVILVAVLQSGGSGGGSGEVMPAAVGGGSADVQKAVPKVADTSGIAGVVAYDTTGYPQSATNGPAADALPHNHVDGPVRYSVTPPVGGDHNATWMNCGIYDKPVVTERAVHNLEHGAVWITYRPDLPAAQVQQLRDFVTRQKPVDIAGADASVNGHRFIDLTPWADSSLPAPIVLSSWGHQLTLTSATDARMQTFVDTFRVSRTYAPEYGAACSGQPVDVGGRPLAGA